MSTSPPRHPTPAPPRSSPRCRPDCVPAAARRQPSRRRRPTGVPAAAARRPRRTRADRSEHQRLARARGRAAPARTASRHPQPDSAERARLPRAGADPRALGGAQHPPPRPERLRQRLLLGRRQVDARLVSQLLLRLLRPRRPDHRRQATARRSGSRRPAPSSSASRRSACCCPRRSSACSASACSISIMRRPFGQLAALAGALTLAVFPAFVASSRDNNVDLVLILLMLLACGAALRAIRGGRWPSLLACAVLVGLAFNTKTLAAYLVVPGHRPRLSPLRARTVPAAARQAARRRRLMVAVSFAWIALRRSDPGLPAPLRRRLDRQHRARPDLRLQRLRPRRRRGRRTRRNLRAPRRRRAVLAGTTARALHLSPSAPAPPRRRRPTRSCPTGTTRTPPPSASARAAASVRGRPRRPGRLDAAVRAARHARARARHALLADPPGSATCLRTARRWQRLRRDPRTAGLVVLGGWFLTRGPDPELLQGHRAPLLHLRARTRHRRDGRRRRRRLRALRRAARLAPGAAAARRRRRRSPHSSCCCTARTTCTGTTRRS